MGVTIIPSLLAASAAAARDRAVLDAFAAAGADAPSAAVPLATLPPLDSDVLAQLLDRGAVREGAPGTFYRYVSTRPSRQTPAVLTIALVVLLLIAGLALLLGVLVARRGAR
jgi:hypothetical protein